MRLQGSLPHDPKSRPYFKVCNVISAQSLLPVMSVPPGAKITGAKILSTGAYPATSTMLTFGNVGTEQTKCPSFVEFTLHSTRSVNTRLSAS